MDTIGYYNLVLWLLGISYFFLAVAFVILEHKYSKLKKERDHEKVSVNSRTIPD